MAFGFDARLILAGQQPDAIGKARTMADLLQSSQAAGMRREQHQHTLASMLRQQAQEQRRAGVYQQHAANPEGLGQALMEQGFGPEGMELIHRAAQAEAAKARLAAEQQATESARKFQLIRDAIQNRAAEKRARIVANQQQARGTTIPGFEIAPDAAPTADDAKSVKASLAAAQRMKRYVAELRGLHKKYGTEYGGATGNRMQQLATQILLEGKNIGELGALSGPDMGIIEKIAASDPGSLGANLKALVGIDSTQANLDGLEQWVDNTLSGNMEAYGYRKSGGQQQAAPAAAHPAGRKRIRDVKTGRTGWWDGKSALPAGVEVING